MLCMIRKAIGQKEICARGIHRNAHQHARADGEGFQPLWDGRLNDVMCPDAGVKSEVTPKANQRELVRENRVARLAVFTDRQFGQ